MAEAARSLGADCVGNYQLLGKLGAGGMGVVYKARDLKLQRTVAVKFLAQEDLPSTDKKRLLREARAASVLDHVNIATVHAVEETPDGRLFMVTGYYEGETLAEKIRRGTLQLPQALDIACQIARGLEHAHAHGIIHRDIKPSNVVVTREGVAKIVDFGLARHSSLSETTASVSLSGTFSYMSPEQAKGQPLDARTDIWSLGVLLYQMATGRLPFEAPTPAATLLAIISAPPAPIIEVGDEWQMIIFRALSKSCDARYANCAEMLQDLQKLALHENQSPPSVDLAELRKVQRAAEAPPVPHPRRPAFRSVWAWATVLLVAALALALALRWRALARQPAMKAASPASVPPANTLPLAYESYLKGREYLQRYDKAGNLESAIASFESAVKADPGFALGYAGLGEAYWDKFRLDSDPQWLKQAETYCKRAIGLNDQLPVVHVILGRIYSAADNQLALQEFQRALKLDPHNADALLGLASVYDHMGRTQEAGSLYQEAAVLQPEYWSGHLELARYYFYRFQYDKAAQEYRRAIELTPDNALARSGLGAALKELGLLAEAEAELKKSLQLQPTYVAYGNLGNLYYQQRRWAESAAMALRALELNSADYRLWSNLGLAYEWLNEPDKAEHAYREELVRLEEVVKLSPEDAALRAELAVLCSKRRLRQKALLHMQAALARAPEDPLILSSAAEVYENLGDRTNALTLITKALKNGRTLDQLQHNPSLRKLLADPRFHQAAAKLAATAPQH